MSEGFIAVPGANLYFREVGLGKPVVVLHGGPDFDHRYLLPELDVLASAFRLVYYDQRGRGRSTGEAADITIGSEVEDLERLCRHLHLDRPAILGHSWGGLLAMEFATRHPGRASHLVLMNTAPASHADVELFRSRRQRSEPETLAKMRGIAATPEFAAGDIETEARYYRLHYGSTLRAHALVDRLVARLRVGATPGDVLRARAIEDRLNADTWDHADYDLRPKLGALTVDALVLHAQYDLIPLDCVKPIAEAIGGAHLAVLADCGHFAYMEEPQAVFHAIDTFFRR
ncbi:MAG TPA: alpha/beta fold hydrolase [Usitatibacter sp.]|jgi:proline iminopeptidase|nr:alpha/beta fold hydrolase [Usitatibacter sp.]